MPWPDDNTLPGETLEAALRRRVMMHEFLAPGGVRQVDKSTGAVTYSAPVDPATTPQCPWHEGDCTAWREIVEGRGTGTVFSPTIVERREGFRDAKKPRPAAPAPTPAPAPAGLSAGLGDVIEIEGAEDE